MNKTSQLLLLVLFTLVILNIFVIRVGFQFIPKDLNANLEQYVLAPLYQADSGSELNNTRVSGSNNNDSKRALPLIQLVQSDKAAAITCPDGASPILDTIREEDNKRRIPRVVHITAKSRCATPQVHDIVNRWRFEGHSLYFHDDYAVKRLTSHPLSQSSFPLLNETLKCVTNGATKSDLWRYLVLHTYGGLYTDIDNEPTGFNGTSISDNDDSFFVIEALGIMSQFFIASSPGHPLMRLSLESGMNSLRGTVNVMRNNPAKTTGPAALKNGFIQFMNGTSTGYIDAGTYVGLNNRSVTVIGDRTNPKEYIDRGGLDSSSKRNYYAAMGMQHFHDTNTLSSRGRISCMDHLKLSNGTNKVANYIFNGSIYVDIIDQHDK